MRKAQKLQAEELVRQMEEAHDQIKKFIEQGNMLSAMELLEECQNGGITLGTLIENTEGEGHPTVSLLEEYCELAYQIHEELIGSKDLNRNKVYKLLRQKLIRISNSLKNDVQIRLEVVFFPYKASMWDSLESVYLAAKEDPECDAYCVPIPYYDLNPDHSFGKMHYEGRDYPKDIEVIDWEKYDFEERKPDVIYIHNPYDDCNLVTSVHPRFYSSNLKKYTDTLVYIPYYSTSGRMSKAQSLCPAYIYADYIVIQSPEFRKYFDADIPDQKFLPFGSPKFDRIIKKCQNPPEPSTEWKERMSGRKVYFYNTSIAGMLADTENFLKKMNYVFQCFEGREDVCLLWRPHPLMEATFDSMRPQYRHIYEALKHMFLEKKLGILDTTPDIADAIALSDAYIGDAGTSVTSLFGIVGKPIFILNNRIHSEPAQDSWRQEMIFEFNFLERDRFAVTQGNKLYISEPYQYNYHYFCDLSDEAYGGCYSAVYDINGKRYACPIGAQDILVIGELGIEKKIELEKSERNGWSFNNAWKYKNYLILIPLSYPAVVRYDTATCEITYFREHTDIFIKKIDGRKIVGGSMIYKDNLYIASPNDNRIYQFNIESGREQIIDLPIASRCGCFVMTQYGDEIWLMPYRGNVIVCWNPITGETKEYENLPREFYCGNNEPAFNIPAFYGEYMYLPPCYANMYLKFNMNTGSFTEWQMPIEKEDGSAVGNTTFFWKLSDANESDFMLYSYSTQRLYKINLKTTEYKEISITFDLNEVKRHESGFCKYSEFLRYACVENNFNSLTCFLNNELIGGRFDKDMQVAAYQEIAANYDGSCGEKTHSFVKEGTGSA